MNLWSIQDVPFYENLLRDGVIHTIPGEIEPFHLPAYDWLCEEMKQRGILPLPGVRYPIWAWHTWDWKHKSPDMRLERFRYNEPQVRLEISIPDERVLLSDYENWHYVLNDWFLGTSNNEAEYQKEESWFDALPAERQREEKRKSWQRVFDIEPRDNGWRRAGMEIQATFWELSLSDVKRVSFHPAKRRAKI